MKLNLSDKNNQNKDKLDKSNKLDKLILIIIELKDKNQQAPKERNKKDRGPDQNKENKSFRKGKNKFVIIETVVKKKKGNVQKRDNVQKNVKSVNTIVIVVKKIINKRIGKEKDTIKILKTRIIRKNIKKIGQNLEIETINLIIDIIS
jgi:hypothetical protein